MAKTTKRGEKKGNSPKGKSFIIGKGSSRASLFFRICKECGVPRPFSSNHLWKDHGTIMSRDDAQRMIIVEKKILDGIVREVTETFGGDMERAFLRAKALDASRYVRSIWGKWQKAAVGYPLLKRPFYELFCDNLHLLGMADARVTRYRRGRELVISCTDCYNDVLFAGDILGAVRVGEGREATIDIAERNGEKVFKAAIQEDSSAASSEDFKFSWEVPLPGHINYKRCKRCGTPFPVSFFTWDIPRGTVIDTHNGEAVSLIEVAGINAVYEKTRERAGSEFDDFLAREVKEMVDEILPGLQWKHRRPEEMIRDLFFLAYRGMGNPIFTELIGDGIKARVENPFNYPLVAGIATSFLARGKPVTFEWERSLPGRLEIYIHFQ
jgi:hypothetical protein